MSQCIIYFGVMLLSDFTFIAFHFCLTLKTASVNNHSKGTNKYFDEYLYQYSAIDI